jgi:hypothetical protein
MLKSELRHRILLFLVVLAIASGVGCAHPSAYKAPVAKFRDASAVVIESAKAYLTELNKTERDIYIQGEASKPAQIKLADIEEHQVFSKEAIAVRLNALDTLANYTDLLNQLANSDAPDQVKTKAADLQTALTGLSGQVKSLTGTDDAQFKSVAGKVLPVIGEVLQAFAEKRIEDALKKAIDTGAGPVNELIQAIEVDITLAFERKKSEFSQLRLVPIDQYNIDLKGADRAKLQADVNAISATEDRWDSFLNANPKDGLEAMKRANDALVKLARTPKPKITDFASFVDTVESFAATANRVGKAVHELTGK